MATKQYALPLDENSKQTGDVTFKTLSDNGTDVIFELTNVTAGTSDQLNLITSRDGKPVNHPFAVTVGQGKASVTLKPSEISDIYVDADGGDWDYVEANWTLREVDTQDKSEMSATQESETDDYFGWPPKN